MRCNKCGNKAKPFSYYSANDPLFIHMVFQCQHCGCEWHSTMGSFFYKVGGDYLNEYWRRRLLREDITR